MKSENFKLKFTPFTIPVIIVIFVLIYRFVFIPLDVYFLGFVAAFLLGTALFMLVGSALGWIIYFIYRLFKKGK